MRCDMSNQAGAAGALAEIARHLAQVRGPRVFGLVDAMAEAGDLLLARELAANEVVDALAARVLAEVEQHPHHVGVGAAVQRPFERADRRDDRRIDVGQRGRGHASRKRRGVQLVIGVQRSAQRRTHATASAFGRLPVSM